MAPRREKIDVKSFQPSLLWRLGVFLVLAVTFLCIDQISKTIVRAAQQRGLFPVEVVPGVLDFTYVENRGASFGIAEGFGLALVALAAIMVAVSLIYLLRAPLLSRLEVIGLGMMSGGAIGNAIDRIAYGFVTDFITTRFMVFPSFNVADIGITVGVALAFIGFAVLSPANAEAKRRAEADRATHGDSAVKAAHDRRAKRKRR